MKKALKFLLFLLLIVAIGFGGYYVYNTYFAPETNATDSAEPTFITHAVALGNLTKSVDGSGSIQRKDAEEQLATTTLTLKDIHVDVGDLVKAGDLYADIDTKALQATIASLEKEVQTLEGEMTLITKSFDNHKYITTSQEGRVKTIYAQEGKTIGETQSAQEYVIVLSTQGVMQVVIDAKNLAYNSEVTIKYDDKKYTGTVIKIVDEQAYITFSDSSVLPGEEVSVVFDNVFIGEGKAEIPYPYYIRSSLDGYVDEVLVSENSKTSRNTKLISVKGVEISNEYIAKQEQYQETILALNNAKALLKVGKITIQEDGIIASINSNGKFEVDDELYSLYVGNDMQMVVEIDELDILNVKVNQPITILMDAMADTPYTGTVEKISQIGKSEGGVTVYNVTLAVNGDENLLIGMNGTASIEVLNLENVVLVPLAALHSSKAGSYVLVPSKEEEPAIVNVTTGLSNEHFVQVLQGLEVGDEVIMPDTSKSLTPMQEMMMLDMKPAGGKRGNGPNNGSMPKRPGM